MAGGRDLGALISLTQGLDLSPLKNAQQFGLQNQQLQAQIAASLSGQGLEQQRIDISRNQGLRNTALAERELTQREKLALSEQDFRGKQAAQQRSLDSQLAGLQNKGRMDLQELRGTQEIAQLNLQSELDEDLQERRFEFELEQDEKLFTFKGDQLTKELDLRRDDLNFRVEKAIVELGIKGGQALLENEASKYRNALLKIDADQGISDKLRADSRLEIENDLMGIELDLMRIKLRGEISEENQKRLNALTLDKAEEDVKGAKAGRESLEVETAGNIASAEAAGLKVKLDKDGNFAGFEKAEPGAAAEAGFLSDAVAASGTVTRGATAFLTAKENDLRGRIARSIEKTGFFGEAGIGKVTGFELAENAFKAIEELADDQSEEAIEARKKLRRAVALGVKLKRGGVGGFFGDASTVEAESLSTIFASSNLSEAEEKELLKLIQDIEDSFDFELVD